MATGYIPLPAQAWNSTKNVGGSSAQLEYFEGDSAVPKAVYPRWKFAQGAQDRHALCTFHLPANYASAPVFILDWTSDAATTATVQWATRIFAASEGDDVESNVSDSENTATEACTTAEDLVQTTITCTNNDSVAADDLVTLILLRDLGDDSPNDAFFLGGIFTYTTT